MFKPFFLIGILTLWLAGHGAAAKPVANLFDQVAAASVEVLVDGRLSGSGWFAAPGDRVVTAAHVIAGKHDTIEITSPTVERQPVTVEAVDFGHDLALLRMPAGAAAHPFLTVADRMPLPGDEVFVFGAVQFRHELLLRGVVAQRAPSYEYIGAFKDHQRIYHVGGAAPLGTSGGCWVDHDGRVVGNQTGYIMHQGAPSGVAFVVPPDAIRRLVTTRQSATTTTMHCAVEELWEQPLDFIKRFPRGTEGIVTVAPEEHGPAQRAGLTKENVIVAVDGKRLRYRDQFLNMIRAHKPGDEVTLEVLKADDPNPTRVTVTLERLEDSAK